MGGTGRMKYFRLEEAPQFANKFVLRFDYEKDWFPNGTSGSYNVFASRLLNLDYVDFLRFSRDVLGAELIGKGRKYVIPFYLLTPEVDAMVDLLNARMKYVLKEREDPYTYVTKEDGTVDRVPIEYYDE